MGKVQGKRQGEKRGARRKWQAYEERAWSILQAKTKYNNFNLTMMGLASPLFINNWLLAKLL